ncbi:hypothetical protein PRZ48_008360 [Zasmidium cellare]|uniref:Beta-xylosidase C-terminal Concanavalin A-like domain-containing protein n=1 Tax=Zasmidium cellare TaxID=395010 RepID=A0ABR0EFM7_ZASCE|nr:hypothetical protein PRZ48_008360 [Zasmidium cellare]
MFKALPNIINISPGLPVYASKDLINWRHISNAWNREAQLPNINLETPDQQWGMFAPNLRYHDGLFYMTCVYAGINTTSEINGTILTTPDPFDDASWTIPFVWEAPARTIDPDLFWDDDGTTYLTWSGIAQQTIDLSTGALSELISLWNGSSGVWAEGPHIYKKDGYYYLQAAEGGTQLGHMTTIARSRNISGPYKSNPANPLLSAVNTTGLFQTVGHADLFQDAGGNWWGVALTTRSGPEYEVFPMGREAALFPVTWDEGKWPFATQVEGVMSGWPLPQHDRSVKPSIANLTGIQDSTDPVLNGQAGIAFVGRKQTDSLFTFTVDLAFQPDHLGFEAGATMFFTQWQHIDLGIVRNDRLKTDSRAQYEIVLRSTNATSNTQTVDLPVSWLVDEEHLIRLTIEAVNTTHYHFAAAPVSDLNVGVVVDDVSARLVSSTWGNQAGSGSAILVGVYATTDGRNVSEDGLELDDYAYFSRWRYFGRGQEVDFGTFVLKGTGTWALEVAERYPNLTIEALDINLNETPPKSWLPSNVTFSQFDLLKDIPDALVVRYDIVHVQFVMIFVSDSNVDVVIKRLLSMLKPRGYLQWTDSNSNLYSWRSGREGQEPVEVPKLYNIAKEVTGDRGWKLQWLNNFEDLFKRAGLEDVKYLAPEPKVSTLQPVMMNWIWALVEGFGYLRVKNPAKADVIDRWMEQKDKAIREVEELKVGMNMRTQRCIGRKPIS